MTLDSRKPMLHEPCNTPLIKPRVRIGHCSIASAAPAGHSAPMPMPRRVRKISRKRKVGEKPAMKLQIEYQKIEIINGVLRPIRSASQPDATAPTSRIHKVSVKTIVTSVVGTWNSSAIGLMISRKTVKSNASSVQPSQAAHQAYHWSLVGSRHHATRPASITAIAHLLFGLARFRLGLIPECREAKRKCQSFCRSRNANRLGAAAAFGSVPTIRLGLAARFSGGGRLWRRAYWQPSRVILCGGGQTSMTAASRLPLAARIFALRASFHGS